MNIIHKNFRVQDIEYDAEFIQTDLISPGRYRRDGSVTENPDDTDGGTFSSLA